MFESCESCGGRLHSYEGEVYCPDCMRWEAVRLADEADEEARALRLVPAPPWEEGPTDGPPW
jgi:uncharacterized Zn finger protein (UPF0148 family)